MIWLGRTEVFRRMIYTLNPFSLEFVGAFRFIVREKKIVKLYDAEVPQYCLYLSTEAGDYGSTLTVSRKKYEQAKLGEPFGLCGVIRNINREDFILITEDTKAETAISRVVRKSWLKMIFLLMVLGLFLGTMLIMFKIYAS